jgi:hypothetical protein
MKNSDHLLANQQKLAELSEKELRLKEQLKTLGADIQKKATPMGIAKDVMSDMFGSKSGVANTATAALGLGATLVAGNLIRKQQQLSLVGKVTGLAVGFLINRISKMRKKH